MRLRGGEFQAQSMENISPVPASPVGSTIVSMSGVWFSPRVQSLHELSGT